MARMDETMLSAFLDGELSPSDQLAFEEQLANDPALQAMLERLLAADQEMRQVFDAELEQEVPDSLVSAIMEHDPVQPANEPSRPSRLSPWPIAASFAALIIGATGGYFFSPNSESTVVATRGWLDDIADYHRVYAKQVRHLVEVGADEADHIQTWLTNTVGAPVVAPDLSGFGLEFQGGRLLVAAGKPVAQLIYTDAEGAVVALCVIQSDTPRDSLGAQQRAEFEMVVWGGEGSNIVLVGDEGRTDLMDIAQSLATDI